MLPSYGSSWPGEGSSEPHAPLWRRLARWLPALLLAKLSLCCFAAVLLLLLLPTLAIAAPLGDEMALPVSAGLGWGLLGAFLLVSLLAVASYVKAARLAPGAIPLWLCSREPGDQAYFHNVLQAVEKKADSSLRFCTKCGAFKPDRTHHCAQLGQCVLVLQHWSVWCNNAVGFYNYKCYLLALLYGGLAHGAGAAMLLPAVVRGIRDAVEQGETPPALEGLLYGGSGSVQAFALLSVAVSCTLALGALSWLLCHAVMAARGVTAAEAWRQGGCSRRKPPKPPLAGRPFDFSARTNLAKVLGRHPILWLLPTNQGIEGNGIFFELSAPAAAADNQYS